MSTSRTREKADKLTYTQAEVTAKDTAARAGRKNLTINGSMQVAQRGMSTGVVIGALNADRWRLLGGVVSPVFTVTQGIGPTGAGTSLKYATTTASTTTVGNTYIQVTQNIEGLNLQALAKGTSSAKSVTLSFWVKANQTGTYAVNLWDATAVRQNSASYTVSAANTWEKKSIVLGPDTTGTIDNDNTVGLALNFILASGSTYTGGSTGVSAHAFGSTNYAPNQSVNVAANVGDYWEVAEVQMEVGSVATDFEHRSFGEILADCQRYFYATETSKVILGHVMYNHENRIALPDIISPMRATPSITVYTSNRSASGQLTEFSSGVSRAVNAVSGASKFGGGYIQASSGNWVNPVYLILDYDAEL